MHSFTPKVTANGDVRWTGFYTTGHASGGTTYVMKAYEGPSETSRGVIEVVRVKGGWELIVDGESVDTFTLKTAAQRHAERLCNS